jgi:hypothetical protein
LKKVFKKKKFEKMSNQSEDEFSKLLNRFTTMGLSGSDAVDKATKEMERRERELRSQREFEESRSQREFEKLKIQSELKIKEMEHNEKMKGCCNN